MLQTWTMATPRITGMAERGGSPVEGGRAAVLDLLDEAGFVGTLASNSEFEIVRYLRRRRCRVGDDACSSPCRRRSRRGIGPGHFVTWVTTYTRRRRARSSAARRSAS